MNARKATISALSGLAPLLGIAAARAADVSAEPPPEAPLPGREWTFTVAPYLWAAGLQGDIGLFGREPVEVDMSFADIFDNLRFRRHGRCRAPHRELGVFGDLIYVKTEADESITRTIAGIPATLSASVETSSLTATLMGEYRAFSDDATTVDLMAGARIWSVDNDINVTLSAGGHRLRTSVAATEALG